MYVRPATTCNHRPTAIDDAKALQVLGARAAERSAEALPRGFGRALGESTGDLGEGYKIMWAVNHTSSRSKFDALCLNMPELPRTKKCHTTSACPHRLGVGADGPVAEERKKDLAPDLCKALITFVASMAAPRVPMCMSLGEDGDQDSEAHWAS